MIQVNAIGDACPAPKKNNLNFFGRSDTINVIF